MATAWLARCDARMIDPCHESGSLTQYATSLACHHSSKRGQFKCRASESEDQPSPWMLYYRAFDQASRSSVPKHRTSRAGLSECRRRIDGDANASVDLTDRQRQMNGNRVSRSSPAIRIEPSSNSAKHLATSWVNVRTHCPNPPISENPIRWFWLNLNRWSHTAKKLLGVAPSLRFEGNSAVQQPWLTLQNRQVMF